MIIFLTDDQGYGDLSCTGNPVLKTPHLDRLAAEGVSIANFHVDAYCTPTRSALMAGRYCHRVGGWGTINGRNMLRDEEVTMAMSSATTAIVPAISASGISAAIIPTSRLTAGSTNGSATATAAPVAPPTTGAMTGSTTITSTIAEE